MSTLSKAASSLVLPSFAPKAAVPYFALKPTSLSPPAVGLRLKSLSASPPFPSFDVAPRAAAASRFLRRLAVSSDIDPEEEGEGGFLADDRGRTFSPDLKLVVGNLPFNFDSSQVAGLFESVGNVQRVEVIYYDKETRRRSTGYAIVTMSSVEEVRAAALQFNGYKLDGRFLKVKYGKPRVDIRTRKGDVTWPRLPMLEAQLMIQHLQHH